MSFFEPLKGVLDEVDLRMISWFLDELSNLGLSSTPLDVKVGFR